MEATLTKTAYTRKAKTKIREEIMCKVQLDGNNENQMIEMLLDRFLSELEGSDK